MKKAILTILYILGVIALAGCGVKDPPQPAQVQKNADGIDIDLTALSSTMVYSEVYNMMYAPERYMGKTIKMEGEYYLYHDDATDKNYYCCIIKDATACCSQGIEFELTDKYKYPDDFPEEGSTICVSGVFDTYQEDGRKYCVLRNAVFI